MASSSITPSQSDESNCDDVIQDGKKSVRDIKFIFDQASCTEPSKEVVFPTMRNKPQESSTDGTVANRIKKFSRFEVPKGDDAKERTIDDTEEHTVNSVNGVVEEKENEEPRTPEKPKIAEKPTSPIKPKLPEKPKSPVDPKAPEKPKVAEKPKSPQKPKTPEKPNATQMSRDSVSLRASGVITSSFSFLPQCSVDETLTVQERDEHKQTSCEEESVLTETHNINEGQMSENTDVMHKTPESHQMKIDNKTEAVNETSDVEKPGLVEKEENVLDLSKEHSTCEKAEHAGTTEREGSVEDDTTSRPMRNSDASRVSQFITSSFSFLPEIADISDDALITSDALPVGSDTNSAVENHSVVNQEANDMSTKSEDEVTMKNDTAVENLDADVVAIKESDTSQVLKTHNDISRSSSQSSTDSAILRSPESRNNLQRIKRQGSRKGFVSDDGDTLVLAMGDDKMQRLSDQAGNVDAIRTRNSTGSDSPRLRSKVERSSSSGSYDGSRTLERLRSRSRSNSPGVSDDDDDEDDDDGIYAETFRYSSYIFVGDADYGGMSFSASTPDFSTLQRRQKAKKASDVQADQARRSNIRSTDTSPGREDSVDVDEGVKSGIHSENATRLCPPGVKSRQSVSDEEEGEDSVASLDASRDSTLAESDDIANVKDKRPHFTKNHQRTESASTTVSEKEFRSRYQAQSTKHVQRSDSTISYKRLSDRTYNVERTLQVAKQEADKGYGFHVRGSCPVVVSSVEKGGPADRGGLRVGDVLLEIENVDVTGMGGGDLKTIITPDSRSLMMCVAQDKHALEHLDSGQPIISSYLNKQGGMLKTWRRRWFALHKDNCLYYYKSPEDSDPLGAVLLTNYIVSKPIDVNRPHCFKLTKFNSRTYVFQADNEANMTLWAEKIQQATTLPHTDDTFLSKSTHNVTLPACSIKNPCCHGYLYKCGNRRKNWRRRYCVMKDACMYYYLDIDSSTAQGVAHYHGYTVSPGAMGRKYGFTLVPPEPCMRTYYFYAETEACYTRWVTAMEKSIARWVRVPDQPKQ